MEKLSKKDIYRSMRDFDNIMQDLLNADIDTYDILVNRFVIFINGNKFLKKIVSPLINMKIEFSKILVDLKNGWYQIYLPVDIIDHLAFVLQLFYAYYNDENKQIIALVQRAYPQRLNEGIYQCLNEFNIKVVGPALRELINRINDFIEDEVGNKEEIQFSNIQVFNIGNVDTGGGHAVIGKDISIVNESDTENFREQYIKALLEHNYKMDAIDQLRPIINELYTEITKKRTSKKIILKILQRLLKLGGNLAIQLFIQIVAKPELIPIAEKVLKNV